MHRKRRVLKSVLTVLLVVGVLFGLLTLLPVLAQRPQRGRAAPDEPFAPVSDDAPAHPLGTSSTGYLIDDGATGFFTNTTGPDGWNELPGGYGGSYLYSEANDGDGDWAEWRPDLPAGTYDVQVHYDVHATYNTKAQYRIFYDGGSVSKYVDQTTLAYGAAGVGNSGWESLGLYAFRAGTSGYVRVTDADMGGSGAWVVADAVKFAPTELWVDDNYCTGCTNDGYIWSVTAFDTIQDGVNAVADGGTVHVKSGTYTENITITKGIILTADSDPVISVVTGTAVAILADDVTVSGFTIECTGPGETFGIANYDGSVWTNVNGYRVSGNTIYGFRYGMWMYQASGEIQGNTIRDNFRFGIGVESFDSGDPKPTTVSDNILYDNGDGTTDYDIQVRDSYTGTLVAGNTITGSLGAHANEAGIHVLDEAGDLTLSENTITGCTEGVRVWQAAVGPIGLQTVDLQLNTITGGTIGVYVGIDLAAFWTARQLTIGGDLAVSNDIYGNSQEELYLFGYRATITATHNYWGVCTVREIEDEIRHQNDFPASTMGTVHYRPARCVPYTLTVEAADTSLPANGSATTAITATAVDVAGEYVNPGTMMGITTSLGAVTYGYVEGENSLQVVWTGLWTTPAFARASGGQVAVSSNPLDAITWVFRGEAVSLIYMKRLAPAGKAEVSVDGTLMKTIDMTSATGDEFRVEEVIASGLSTGVDHTIEVRPDASGNDIWVDALRSGGVVAADGQVTTTLTAASTSGTATVWGTVYNGVIITSTSTELYPLRAGTVNVDFQQAAISVTKSASPTSLNPGQKVTFEIVYGNGGPELATTVWVTDTLPDELVYVSSIPAYDSTGPNLIAGTDYGWNIGTVPTGTTGLISIVAQPDPGLTWTVPVTVTNAVEIESAVHDSTLADNSDSADVTIVPPSVIVITADPPVIRVSDGDETSELRITVTDGLGNPVDGVGVSVTTTAGSLVDSGGTTLTVTTTNGVAIAELASSTTVETATVTAAVLPTGLPTDSTEVFFKPGLPAVIESVAYPTLIRVCGDRAVVTATIKDEFGNLVEDDTKTTFNVVQGARGIMYPKQALTLNGVVTSTVETKAYEFGERFLDVYILASREAVEAVWSQRIDLEEGLPAGVSFELVPETIGVNGKECRIYMTVTDCAGNGVQDGTVLTLTVDAMGTISPTVVTTLLGRARTTFWSKCTIGSSLVTASVDSLTFSTSVEIEPGPPDLILVDISPGTIRNCGGTAVVTATLWDVCGNLVKDGTPVLFSPQYYYVTTSPILGYTEGGMVTAEVTAGDKPLEAWPLSQEQIDVTSGSAMPGFTNLWIKPGLPETVTVSPDRDEILINGNVNDYNITVTVRVEDCSGTPVEDGTLVTLETDLGYFRETGMWNIAQPTVGGLVTATLTSESTAGEVTLAAEADSTVGTATVRFRPDQPWFLDVWGDPTTIPADGRSYSRITASVEDFWHNAVLDGVTVTLVTDYGYFAQSVDVEYTCFTDAEGKVFADLVADTIPRTALVRAIAYNDRQGYTYVFMTKVIQQIYLPIVVSRRELP